ncbi:MAG: Asp-tRNA(Asn)/Glu-tRNA(Gln) amidotransferase subunit GatC [Alphaproteobacteria bacterium]
MALDKANVRHIAHLARIRVAEADLDKIASELNHIIGWVEQLAEVDTDDIEPMTSVVQMSLKTRADEVTDGGYPEKVLGNAPEETDGFFVVPKVIE